ncbi:glutathione S-transferase Mu 1 [Lingula anatina]|uniref:glutathione transferase n=1 Tax=Lingula anatina TaxID=7574 RepID=A0A1S3I2S2_LINAN|nr:glutathione S-transferase Mu 1 [Lingula anatina]|eukprot:XP_013392126.1 glutathione S-transferase Mu 1 [Lingula anatina]
MPAVLGYWNIRGLAQPIRLMLAYAGEEVEEKRYQMGPAPEFNKDEWLTDKAKLGVPFPNIPYYKDGDTIIVQSRAIMMHLARKHNLYGSTEAERIRADVLASQLGDNLMGFVRVCLSTRMFKADFKAKKEEFLKGLPDTLKSYSDFLGDNPWCAGKSITYADFGLYELLDWFRRFEPGCLDKLPNLVAFCNNFEALPAMKKYMSSAQFLKDPILNPFADWGV